MDIFNDVLLPIVLFAFYFCTSCCIMPKKTVQLQEQLELVASVPAFLPKYDPEPIKTEQIEEKTGDQPFKITIAQTTPEPSIDEQLKTIIDNLSKRQVRKLCSPQRSNKKQMGLKSQLN